MDGMVAHIMALNNEDFGKISERLSELGFERTMANTNAFGSLLAKEDDDDDFSGFIVTDDGKIIQDPEISESIKERFEELDHEHSEDDEQSQSKD